MSTFPFIVGCGRSGTTLLRAMLAAHPDVAVPPESYFVVPALRERARYEAGGRLRLDALLDAVLASGSYGEWQLDPDVARTAVRDRHPADVPSAIRALYQAYAASHGRSRIGDKTPYHVLHIERLAAAFSDACFVHIIRDGRDVASSLVDMPFGPRHFGEASLYWRHHVSEGRRAGAALGPARYLEVSFEELVAEPEEVLQRVCRLAALDFDPAMLAYRERAGTVLSGLRRSEHLKGISEPLGSARRDWRRALTPQQVALFEELAGDVLGEVGYDRASPAPPARKTRLAAVAVRAIARARGALTGTRFRLVRTARSLRGRRDHRPTEG